MDLSIYNVILGPVITDKAYELNKRFKKLVLWVHPAANKPLVKEAFKKLFNVEVENVRIMIRGGKTRRVGRRLVQGSSKKKAIVTLAEGYSLDLFDQAGTGSVAGERVANVENN